MVHTQRVFRVLNFGLAGFTTITSTAILFAKTTLNMPPSSLILIGIISPVSGIAGSLLWPHVQRRCGWSNLRILVTLVCLASLLPAYGCLGFLKVFREGHIKFGGLTTPGEMYALAVYFVSSRVVKLAAPDTFRSGICIRGFPRIRTGILLGIDSPWRRGTLVCSLFHHGQGQSVFGLSTAES